MLDIPLYDNQGNESGQVQVDPVILGDHVRPRLLKQAVVTHLSCARQNTSATKSRGMVSGSTRKLYRQKGTGNARAGQRRTHKRRGGGVAFAKGKQNYDLALNKKMRRLARNNAILAKLQSCDVAVIEDLDFDRPGTKKFAAILDKMGFGCGCVLAMAAPNRSLYLSGRNMRKTEVEVFSNLNAYSILRRKKFLMTRSAFVALTTDPVMLNAESAA